MTSRFSVGLFAVMATFAFMLAAPAVKAATNTQSGSHGSWEQQAEKTFNLEPGFANQLLSKDKWENYQKKMEGMNTNERMAFKKEMHGKLMREAKQRGMDVPEMPPGHGKKGQTQSSLLLLVAAGGGAGGAGGMGAGGVAGSGSAGATGGIGSGTGSSGFTGNSGAGIGGGGTAGETAPGTMGGGEAFGTGTGTVGRGQGDMDRDADSSGVSRGRGSSDGQNGQMMNRGATGGNGNADMDAGRGTVQPFQNEATTPKPFQNQQGLGNQGGGSTMGTNQSARTPDQSGM